MRHRGCDWLPAARQDSPNPSPGERMTATRSWDTIYL